MAKRRWKMHPLRAKRRPGPAGHDEPSTGERDLQAAAAVLELIETGALARGTPLSPLGIPCDAQGRPLRRLTPEDEAELAFRIQTFGDLEARNTLVLANMGLVHLLANQMRRPHLRYDDLVQEGVLGLFRATETFDPAHGVRFSTYCVYWIRAKIQRFIQRIDRDDTPSVPGVGMVEDDDGKRHRPRAARLSLDATSHYDAEDERTLGDTIADQSVDDPERATVRAEQRGAVQRALHGIAEELDDPRLSTIIERRLLAEEPQTLAELGSTLELSREGARLLEGKVLKLARARLAAFADV